MMLRPTEMAGLVLALCVVLPAAALAQAGSAGVKAEPGSGITACLAALSGDDGAAVEAGCGSVLRDEATLRVDRLTVLKARGAFLARHDKIDAAIADYGRAIELDGASADLFNARGELWRAKGERPRAVQDFAAALRLDPGHDRARANNRAMARELERIGAEMALPGTPSFACRQAKRLAEKAICADPELGRLDRAIAAATTVALARARDPGQAEQLRRQRDGFLAERDARMGQGDYDLKKAMATRLHQLTAGGGL
ncbi:MAG: hypothetical protein FWD68_11595 [Alphaproteobacteria bacterium]|nr:hypothetical protein [Alphaproteobacteria bacterium]